MQHYTETFLNKLVRNPHLERMKSSPKFFITTLLGVSSIFVAKQAEAWAGNLNVSINPPQPHTTTLEAINDTIAPDTLPVMLPAAEDAITPTVSAIPNDSTTAAIVKRLQGLMENTIFERTQVGLYVYDLTADAPIFAHGEHQQLRPASCEKLITAISALQLLGTDYNYTTTLSIDGQVTDSVLHGDVYLRGGFDPLFDRSDLRQLADALRNRGIHRIEGKVYFDRSLKDTSTRGWGWCWDDDVTPLTPLLYERRTGLEQRFLSELQEDSLYNANNVHYAETPRRATLLAQRTHSIDQILLPMMKKSDNLFAESLFYQIAAQSNRPFADYKRGTRAISQFLGRIGISSDTYQIADGSGLSLYNYLTPHLLVSALRYAYRHENIYRHLLPALPIAGEDGTLRHRMTSGAARGNVKAKTGTVEGVSSLAGYLTAPNGHTFCFAIMNQGIRHTSTGRNFQDRVCKAIVEQ